MVVKKLWAKAFSALASGGRRWLHLSFFFLETPLRILLRPLHASEQVSWVKA
jgi:hypothetical protein